MVREMIAAAANGGGFVAYRYPRAGSTVPVLKLSYTIAFKANGSTVGSGIYIDDVDAIFWGEVRHIGAFAALTLLLVTGFGFVLARSIARPVVALTARDVRPGGRRA